MIVVNVTYGPDIFGRDGRYPIQNPGPWAGDDAPFLPIPVFNEWGSVAIIASDGPGIFCRDRSDSIELWKRSITRTGNHFPLTTGLCQGQGTCSSCSKQQDGQHA